MLVDYNGMINGLLKRGDIENPLSIMCGSTDRHMEMGVLELGDGFYHVSSFDFVEEYLNSIAAGSQRKTCIFRIVNSLEVN